MRPIENGLDALGISELQTLIRHEHIISSIVKTNGALYQRPFVLWEIATHPEDQQSHGHANMVNNG